MIKEEDLTLSLHIPDNSNPRLIKMIFFTELHHQYVEKEVLNKGDPRYVF